MAENMKRRISKWDVATELHEETVGHDSAVPAEVDDPCMDLSEVDTIKPILSMNLHGSEINQSASQSGEEKNNNIVHSDDICEKIQYSEQFDLEGDCQDGFKKQDWEPASQDRTMADCAENQEKPHNAAYDMSHDAEEGHQRTHNLPPIDEQNTRNLSPIDERTTRNLSPIDERNRSHRKRSRSKSPSFVSKQGSERWTDKGRMRGMTPVCRAFADGKCRRGNECRFLHEGGGWGQTERHHDAGSTDEMGSRSERERPLTYGSKETHTDTPEKGGGWGQTERHHDTGSNDGMGTRPERERPLAYGSKETHTDTPEKGGGWGQIERHHDAGSTDGMGSRPQRERPLAYGSKETHTDMPEKGSGWGQTERHHDTGSNDGMGTRSERERPLAYGNKETHTDTPEKGGGWGQTERHHDAGSTDGMGSRPERERPLAYGNKETHTDTQEKTNYTRERPFRRPEEHSEDGWGNNNEPRQGYHFNERCFDFTRGRCYRGAACRYIHHDASSDGGWSVRDESRGRVHDIRDGSESFNRRPENQRFINIPCRYFLRGHCVHGENCKFIHQVGPPNIPVERSLDGSQHSFVSGGTSDNTSGLQDQTTHRRTTNPRSENKSGVSVIQPVDKQNYTNRSIYDSHPVLTRDAHKETQPSEQKTTTPKVSKELSSHDNLPTISVASHNAENRGRSQFAPQLLHPQSFGSNSSFHKFAPPFPLKGQMQQGMRSNPQNEKNQFAARHKPPDDHSFNAGMENLYANPSCYQLNPKNLDSRGQVKQNIPMISHSGSNFNLNNQIQQIVPLIHSAQNQPDFSVAGQIQQNLAPHIGRSHLDIISTGNSQQILPQTVQSQAQSVSSLVSNGQNHLPIFNSDEKNCESTMKNNSIQIGQGSDPLEVKPSPFNSDNSITHKVVTSEQAAKIIDLSASLAQFFGTAAQNSQSSASVNTPRAFLNPSSIGSLVTTVAPPPTEIEGSQTNLSLSSPKPNQQIHVTEIIKQVDDSSSREVTKIEAQGNNIEQPARLQNGDAEGKKDGDSKKIKEAKEIRMFKCALIEFVKEMLKPKWKEGQLSKEAYKTIVKKVVDKVCGSLQGPNVPQTQEKIDLYLLNSKAKLSKLVQAYVEKFVNS